jgi:amidase
MIRKFARLRIFHLRLWGIIMSSLILSQCQSSPDNGFDFEETTVLALQEAMANGELSAVQITQHYLDRIATMNPQLRAVIEVNPDALSIAAALDAERANGAVRSPLHGIPVMLKDNIDTADQMHTTAGSFALLDAPAPAKDAFVAAQLRQSGAILLAKTNLSEWANFRSTSASSGWSGRGGQTLNPYAPGRTVCGSSSGSAAAVAANLTVLAVGTETDGSVVCPSGHASIVGLKPTLGMVSRSGIIPIAHSQDTAGPMARSVSDLALLLTAMVGADAEDDITTNMRTREPLDYTAFLRPGALRGKRIGVQRQLFGNDAALDNLMEAQLKILREAGAELVDLEINSRSSFGDAETTVLLYEFKNDLNNYLYQRGGDIQSLADLIAYNEANAKQEMPDFAQELFVQAEQTTGLGASEYLEALGFSKAYSQSSINSLLQELNLHAIMAPTNTVGWPVNPKGDNTENYIGSSSLAAVSGYPNITVPAGYIDGFPIGISFMGPAFSEPTLIGIAYDYEQRSLARKPPMLATP